MNGSHFVVCSMTLVVHLSVAPIGTAQEYDVRMPENADTKILPTTFIDSSLDRRVWVCFEGLRPLKWPGTNVKNKDDEANGPSGAPPLPFAQSCNVAMKWQVSGDGMYLLLFEGSPGTNTFRHLGWVHDHYCARHGAKETGFGIHRKALIVNTVDSIKREGETRSFAEVKTTLTPSLTGPTGPIFRLLNIFFVYADTDPQSATNGFQLLGTAPQFNPNRALTDADYPRTVIHGWVPKDRLCPWNIRLAVEPDTASERSAPARYYNSIEAAVAAAEGDSPGYLFEEPFRNGKAIEMKFDDTRYPVIPVDGSDEVKDLDKLAARINSPMDGGRLWKVGCVGGLVDKDGRLVASANELTEARRKLEQIRQEIAVTEVMFVLDATSSMTELFVIAANTIEKIYEEVKDNRDRTGTKVRLSITYYTDTDLPSRPTAAEAVKTSPLVDAGSEEAKKIITFLREIATKGLDSKEATDAGLGGGGDLHEMVFEGLKRGIDGAQPSQWSRKIVILLGDMGDRVGDDPAEINAVLDRLSGRIVRAPDGKFVPDRSPVEMYALQFADPDKEKEAADFRRQILTIQSGYAKRMAQLGLQDLKKVEYEPITNRDTVVRNILDRYETLRKQAQEFDEVVRRLQLGDWDGLKVGPEMEKLMTASGVDIEKWKAGGGGQIFGVGYVWEYHPVNGKRQVRPSYFVSKGDLQYLFDHLEGVTDTSLDSDGDFSRSVREALVGVGTGDINPRTGKPYSEMSFRDLRLKERGLQVQSELLQLAMGKIEYGVDYLQKLERVRKKIALLRAIDKGESVTFRAVPKRTTSGEEYTAWVLDGVMRKDNRFFPLYGQDATERGDSGTLWIYLNFDEEWP